MSTWDRAARIRPLASSPSLCRASIERAPGGTGEEVAADGMMTEGILLKGVATGVLAEGTVGDGAVAGTEGVEEPGTGAGAKIGAVIAGIVEDA